MTYRFDDFPESGEGYVKSVAMVLSQYPDDVIIYVTDPKVYMPAPSWAQYAAAEIASGQKLNDTTGKPKYGDGYGLKYLREIALNHFSGLLFHARSDNFPGMDDLAQVKTKVDCASRMLWRALAYKSDGRIQSINHYTPNFMAGPPIRSPRVTALQSQTNLRIEVRISLGDARQSKT